MQRFCYGNPEASIVLLQLVDTHDLAGMDKEIEAIRHLTDMDFCLTAVKVNRWNADLSPWTAPAVFGNEPFGDGASVTLAEVLQYTDDSEKTYFIGGYSLAGLFALWAAYQTDVFDGVAAASPSLWFPGFKDYMHEALIRSHSVYLSLGTQEPRTRNPVMATVGDRIREAAALLKAQQVNCTLEWNPGNHFKDADLRTAKAFAWLMLHALQA
ncbi:MAG: esterase [Oscillospiraceae bacterium]|nr:esterase [Oscillospiraceae bacterium]